VDHVGKRKGGRSGTLGREEEERDKFHPKGNHGQKRSWKIIKRVSGCCIGRKAVRNSSWDAATEKGVAYVWVGGENVAGGDYRRI